MDRLREGPHLTGRDNAGAQPGARNLDAAVERAGLTLTPAERGIVLDGARRLHRAAALVRAFAQSAPDEPH